MSKVIVTFEKNWRGYAAGETAGFDSSVAEGLIAGGYAAEPGKKTAVAKPAASSEPTPKEKVPAASKVKPSVKPAAKPDPATGAAPVVDDPKP